VANEKGGTRQGPVFFGFLAMQQLEFACRLRTNNEEVLIEFSRCLHEIERTYFIRLPVSPPKPESSIMPKKEDSLFLIWMAKNVTVCC